MGVGARGGGGGGERMGAQESGRGTPVSASAVVCFPAGPDPMVGLKAKELANSSSHETR